MWNQDKFRITLQQAADIHNGQKVPGTDLPYFLHVTWVATEVQNAIIQSRYSFEDPDRALQVALLHDSIEDTPTTREDIVPIYGEIVANHVQALSKNPEVPKAHRMDDCLERILALPENDAAIVKLADRITNLHKPPSFWKPYKIFEYWNESQAILDSLHKRCPFLAKRLWEKIRAYEEFVPKLKS